MVNNEPSPEEIQQLEQQQQKEILRRAEELEGEQ